MSHIFRNLYVLYLLLTRRTGIVTVLRVFLRELQLRRLEVSRIAFPDRVDSDAVRRADDAALKASIGFTVKRHARSLARSACFTPMQRAWLQAAFYRHRLACGWASSRGR